MERLAGDEESILLRGNFVLEAQQNTKHIFKITQEEKLLSDSCQGRGYRGKNRGGPKHWKKWAKLEGDTVPTKNGEKEVN